MVTNYRHLNFTQSFNFNTGEKMAFIITLLREMEKHFNSKDR